MCGMSNGLAPPKAQKKTKNISWTQLLLNQGNAQNISLHHLTPMLKWGGNFDVLIFIGHCKTFQKISVFRRRICVEVKIRKWFPTNDYFFCVFSNPLTNPFFMSFFTFLMPFLCHFLSCLFRLFFMYFLFIQSHQIIKNTKY